MIYEFNSFKPVVHESSFVHPQAAVTGNVIIGKDVVLTVVDIRGDNVRLGIEAPVDIPVHRQEVFDAIQREKRQADDPSADETGTLLPTRLARIKHA